MSKNIRFIHCSDLHLEAPFKGVQLENEEIWKQLEGSTFKSFEKVVQTAIAQQVDFVVIAGDIYNSSMKSIRAQLFFLNQMRLLAHHQIPCLFVHGNHDSLDSWMIKAEFPTSIFQFSPFVSCKSLYRDNEDTPYVNIIGYSYPSRDIQKNIAKEIAAFSQSLDPNTYNVGLLHCNVGGDPTTENYAPCSLQDLLASNIHYWALGHVHTRKILHDDHPAVVYPGNIQGLHINDTQKKGFYIVNVHDGETECSFIETSSFLWFHPTIQVQEKHIDSLIESMIQEMVDQTQDSPGIFRFELEGHTPLHQELQNHNQEMEETIRENIEQENCYLESIRIRTKPYLDMDAIRKRNDFSSLFLKKTEDLLHTENPTEKMKELMDEALMQKLFRMIPGKDTQIPWNRIISQAQGLGLELLSEDQNED
ncbi:MAG: DNA repair exonuclease [Caldisericia bacterium]|nr:DNA repair exonuclease [Caldisericia bacterium]MDD4615476.1 DNA repair exonuclease [Caldisericia bacterium]